MSRTPEGLLREVDGEVSGRPRRVRAGTTAVTPIALGVGWWTAALVLLGAGCGGGATSSDGGAGDAAVWLGDATVSLPDLAVSPDLAPFVGASVLQCHLHATRDGLYVEPAFTVAAAAGIHVDASFVAKVSGPTYANPLFLDGGPGGRDLVFVATEQNEVTAFDANTAAIVWRKVLGSPVKLAKLPCGNIDPLGVTGTPIIDLASRTLVLDAMTTPDDGTTKKHLVFALSVDDGTVRPGWPLDVEAVVKFGTLGFLSTYQNQRGALALQGGVVYLPYGGFAGDCGTYHGWVVGVPLANPSAAKGWATRAVQGGAWAPPGVSSDGKAMFVATGNTGGTQVWADGEAVIRLQPGPTYSQQPTDYFAPPDWQALDTADLDIGGSGAVLFDVPGATPSELAMALGKNGKGYLLDRNNLGGIGTGLAFGKFSPGAITNAPAAYHTAQGTYVTFRSYGGCTEFHNLTAVRIGAAAPPTLTMAWCVTPDPAGELGSPIVTTTDGQSDAIVWTVGAEGDNLLHGNDGDTGAPVFTGGGAGDKLTLVNRYQSPIVAKGRMFVAASNQLYVFTTK